MSGKIEIMIYFFVGENSFEAERELKRMIADFDGDVEKYDADTLQVSDLPDILMGQTLFSSVRMVIIKRLSDNKLIWEVLPEWLERAGESTTVVFVEAKPDKRSRTYKALVKRAVIKEFSHWTTKDRSKVIEWTLIEAKRHGAKMTQKLATQLVDRVGVDQWRVSRALEKLALADELTSEMIEQIIEAHPEENVFQLLEVALGGDRSGLQTMLETLRLETDPYQTFGLLSSQLLQLTALALNNDQSSEVAKDIGAQPFVLSRLKPHAKSLGPAGARKFLSLAAETDRQMKSTSEDPWVLIETLLLKIARG